jgi:hypothetical protein
MSEVPLYGRSYRPYYHLNLMLEVAKHLIFRGGLVSKAHRLVYHSTLASRVIKKKKSI